MESRNGMELNITCHIDENQRQGNLRIYSSDEDSVQERSDGYSGVSWPRYEREIGNVILWKE